MINRFKLRQDFGNSDRTLWGDQMRKAMKRIKKIFEREQGQGMIEYALIISLIAIVVIAAVIFFGNSLTGIFNNTAHSLSDAAN